MREKLDSLVDEMIDAGILFEDAAAEFEKQFILRVLERHRGNVSKASVELRIHRNTLSKRVEKYRADLSSIKPARPRRNSRSSKKRAEAK